MKLYTKEQIKAWDQFTIENEPISSYDLMERAASVFTDWFTSSFAGINRSCILLAGSGNNGGDALAVGRMLHRLNYKVFIYLNDSSTNLSAECKMNLERLVDLKIEVKNLSEFNTEDHVSNSIVIDGLFGIGLSRPLKKEMAEIVRKLDDSKFEIISLDIPSGLHPDEGLIGPCVKASRTLALEIPKKSFFLDESMPFTGEWTYRSIGLSRTYPSNDDVIDQLITSEMVGGLVKKRFPWQNKSDFGFGQLCAGSENMLGAAIFAAKGAARAGIGRLVLSTPKLHHQTCFASCPFAMMQNMLPENKVNLTSFSIANSQVNALAVGPGLSTGSHAVNYLDELLNKYRSRLILDADALNIIAREGWLDRIPKESILTPHLKEFERLASKTKSRLEAVELQRELSRAHGFYIILKGPYSSISSPNGEMYFNRTGNVGMATGGSGDVLTGVLLSLIAQGYHSLDSCILATYIHGLAGDKACETKGVISMLAEDIIDFIPQVIKNIYER